MDYLEQMGTMNKAQIDDYANLIKIAKSEENISCADETSKVNFNKLKQLGLTNLCERVPDQLYTGGKPTTFSRVNGIKKAGIKTIIYLGEYDDDYRQHAKNAGLNYIRLDEMCNEFLDPNKPDVLCDLLSYQNKNPKYCYSEEKIEDLKVFLDILNGKDEDYPPPIYMGCLYGEHRTGFWNEMYKILGQENPKQSLKNETLEKLEKLSGRVSKSWFFPI